MALGGANMVFGVAWLKLLGPVTTNYSHLTMSFVWKDQPITLQGYSGPGPTEVTNDQVKRLLDTSRVAALFYLQLHDTTSPITIDTTPLPPKLRHFLDKYSSLFRPPTCLPPPRTNGHTINLTPNT